MCFYFGGTTTWTCISRWLTLFYLDCIFVWVEYVAAECLFITFCNFSFSFNVLDFTYNKQKSVLFIISVVALIYHLHFKSCWSCGWIKDVAVMQAKAVTYTLTLAKLYEPYTILLRFNYSLFLLLCPVCRQRWDAG